jgi:hypothetical protein
MTYAEQRGKEKFNWWEALSDEPKNAHDWMILKLRAESWTTCACGSQCDIIPRGLAGEPLDMDLRMLGIRFYQAVSVRNRIGATRILSEIERRSTQLIYEINAENKRKQLESVKRSYLHTLKAKAIKFFNIWG